MLHFFHFKRLFVLFIYFTITKFLFLLSPIIEFYEHNLDSQTFEKGYLKINQDILNAIVIDTQTFPGVGVSSSL